MQKVFFEDGLASAEETLAALRASAARHRAEGRIHAAEQDEKSAAAYLGLLA
jgi:hypothetical protein